MQLPALQAARRAAPGRGRGCRRPGARPGRASAAARLRPAGAAAASASSLPRRRRERALASRSAARQVGAGRQVDARARSPGRQKLEICSTAGPLRPRWVNSRSSTKPARCAAPRRLRCAPAGRQPGQRRERLPRRAPSKVSGTSAGRGSTIAVAELPGQRGSRSRWRRSSGIERPPVATTSRAASTGPRAVSSSKPPAPWRTAVDRARLPVRARRRPRIRRAACR